jgi:hypothetical protein
MSNGVFPEKYLKKLEQEFVDNLEGMETEEIKKNILACESHLYEVENEKEQDKDLNDVREKVKELSKKYRENKSNATAKIKYCLFVLENRGVNLDRNKKD